jgi:TetR/AcrR family transcriptional regulator, cholesterol catabolism regulator
MKDPDKMILKNKSADTMAKLIKASVDLFSTRGFKATSVRDIAKAMNMSMAGIYNYFPTKEALFFYIFDRTITAAKKRLIAVTDLDLPPIERFRLLLKTHFTAIGTHLKESKLTFLGDEYFTQENRDKSRRYQVEIMALYLKEIDRLKKAGCISLSQPSSILALNIFGMLNWFIRWYRPEGKLSLEQVIDHIINFILKGINGD